MQTTAAPSTTVQPGEALLWLAVLLYSPSTRGESCGLLGDICAWAPYGIPRPPPIEGCQQRGMIDDRLSSSSSLELLVSPFALPPVISHSHGVLESSVHLIEGRVVPLWNFEQVFVIGWMERI